MSLTPKDRGPLGQYLWEVRTSAKITLREAEDKTKVSNAYLSQIETGKIPSASPQVLHKLANAYGVSYEHLMTLAGHLKSARTRKTPSRLPTLAKESLTPDEEDEILKYLAYLRQRKGTS